MGKCHYCSRCGLELVPCNGSGEIKIYMELGIDKCKDCAPEQYKYLDKYQVPKLRLHRVRKRQQWSKYQ